MINVLPRLRRRRRRRRRIFSPSLHDDDDGHRRRSILLLMMMMMLMMVGTALILITSTTGSSASAFAFKIASSSRGWCRLSPSPLSSCRLQQQQQQHRKPSPSTTRALFSLSPSRDDVSADAKAKAKATATASSSSSSRQETKDSGNRKKKIIKNPWTINDADLLHRHYHPKYVRHHDDNNSNSYYYYDYIIIGSGIGGLWLGACLTKFNFTCLVLEQHDIVGGFQHTFKRGPYEFVPGLHYIANLQLCSPIYDMVATKPPPIPIPSDDEEAPPLPTTSPTSISSSTIKYWPAGDAVHADQGQSHTLKVGNLPTMYVRKGIDNVRSELIRVFPNETSAIDEFIRLTEMAKWQAGQFATFKIFPKWLQWFLSNIVCSNYVHYASLTTEQVLNPLTSDGRLATVLSAFGGDLGESISDGSFCMQAAVLGHILEGCYYPEGGPIQFVRGLVPTIRNGGGGKGVGGDVLTKARVKQILLEKQSTNNNKYRAVGVELMNGDTIHAKRGVISDAGMQSTLNRLLPKDVVEDDPILRNQLEPLVNVINDNSNGISHVFLFVGLNASSTDLKLQSSSFYYIPWNETNTQMDASKIQDYYRDTLLDPNVLDVSAGMVFVTAKDPYYSNITMPGLSTVIVFSEARASDFDAFLEVEPDDEDDSNKNKGGSNKRRRRVLRRTKDYQQAKELIERKMMRSLLLNFPHLEPHVDFVEVGTPLTLLDYTCRTETLGLRHTPQRMTCLDIRPDCDAIDGLYFTGQDVAFAGWAGAMTGAMVTAQRILNYTLLDFAQGKTLMRDLGRGDVEDMIQDRVKQATAANPVEIVAEIIGNAVRNIQQKLS